MVEDVEDVAERLLDAAEMEGPTHPWRVAVRFGFDVRIGLPRMPATVLGRVIVVPDHRVERRGFAVLHELAHVALRTMRVRDTEARVDAVASAVLLPRASFTRDVARLGSDVHALKVVHPFASHEAIARRLVQLGLAAVTVHDRGPRGVRCRRVGARRTPPTLERALVLEAHASGEVVGPPEVRAYPVRDGAWSRVIVVEACAS